MSKIKSSMQFLKANVIKNKVLILSFILIFIMGIVAVPRIFAQPQAIKSVEIFSEKLDYGKKEPGSWKIDKSAKWISKGTAEITFDVDTIMKSSNKYTDILFVLDVSGSMDGEKLGKVKDDVSQLINNLLSNDKNRAGLITFGTNSQIVSGFTNKKNKLIEKVNSLSTSGCTNYYQALISINTVLKNYVKEDDRECIVLFLTDGYPNEETPNEDGQYDYLKNQYPFITINGVQYEMGSSILDPVKKISDNQYVADMNTLNNVLFEASVFPITYENFEITDYIDNNYFYVESERDIMVSQGSIIFDKENQKFTWKMDNLKSGLKSKMIIKAKLKDELIGDGGLYPTNEKEEIKSKIDEDNEDVESLKTPVLADNYKVIYDGNEPDNCKLEEIPAEKQHSVFDTVAISDSVPKCEGYQFKGWDVTTKDVKKVNGDYFIMPEEDVTLKANWSKLDIKKSMEGTVKESLTLYKQVKQDAENNNHAIKYTGATDTFNGTEDVYYYHGNTPNNNVLFANYCWRMYRTTDTGGVKMVYNGEPDAEGKCGTSRGNHVGYGKRTTQELSSNYNYGTDYTYDEVSKTFTLSGDLEQATWNETTYLSLIGKYTCRNTMGSCSTLYYVDSYYSSSSAYVLPLSSTTNYSFIGTSAFNSKSNSPADVGYMYNKRYTNNTKEMNSGIGILNEYSISTNYYYADAVEFEGRFNLVDPYKIESAKEYSNLVGKYTFRSSTASYTNYSVYYIAGVRGSYMYCLELTNTNPDLASANTSYYFADSLVDDGTGKQVLDPATTKEVKATEWFENYAKYNDKYYCVAPDCSTVYYANFTMCDDILNYNILDDYIYGNTFTYNEETGEYTLIGETQHFWKWNANYDRLGNTHYTCWNTTGTCTTLSYIYQTSDAIANYINLVNGMDIEQALDEMLYDDDVNTTNSTIKTVIDSWYLKNLIQYSDYFEDTVWCNDRSANNLNSSGWNPNGGSNGTQLYFGAKNGLTCQNRNDRFTVNKKNGNGALTYPVGLATSQEAFMSTGALSSGGYNWTLSPKSFFYNFAYDYYVTYVNSSGEFDNNIPYTIGIRPSVSLRTDIEYEKGNGTVDSPYVIEMDS